MVSTRLRLSQTDAKAYCEQGRFQTLAPRNVGNGLSLRSSFLKAAPRLPKQLFKSGERAFGNSTTPINVASVETAPTHTEAVDKFSWTKQWYPVAPLDYLDSTKPQGFTVLGYNIVVWKDGEGEWHVFDDQCPHRAAPLSEGRLDPTTGTLQCSYHGWQFDGEGHCVGIPQAPDEKAGKTARASKRSCTKTFPSAMKYDVLWMWMEHGPQAWIDASAQPVFSVPEMESEGGKFFPLAKWYMREVPVSFESLLENNGDPSHVFFTHHGVLAQREKSEPIVLRPAKTESEENGVDYVFQVQGPAFPLVKLVPPSILWAGDPEGKAGNGIGLLLAVTPMRPGYSRIMTLALMANPKLRWLSKLLNWQPWLRHVWNHEVHDGDITVLHRQERYVERTQGRGWRKEYFLPNQSDTGVIALRNWLEKVEGPSWGPDVTDPALPPEETRREVLLDRYQQHTKLCPHCSQALSRIQLCQEVLKMVAGASFLGLAYLFGQGATLRSWQTIGAAATLLISLLVQRKLSGVERKFFYVDYVHAEHK